MKELDLIPVNEQVEDKIIKTIKANKVFASVDQFIYMYNADILKDSNPKVREIAELIADSYKNITLSNKKLVIESHAEVSCANIIGLMKDWMVLLTLKRISSSLFEDEYPPNTKIVFLADKPGIPNIEVFSEETQENILVPYPSDKIVRQNIDFTSNIFTRNLIKAYNDNPNDGHFSIDDLIDIKDDFIPEIEKTILNYSFKTE